MNKIGKYEFMAEPFHCDFSKRLFMGHLGNHLLNAADYHSHERNFGMAYLNPIHKTWVLSRLAIEIEAMPEQYSRFNVETWVESAMKYFTNRNFRISDSDGNVYGYGRSVWAMIDTETRQPTDIFAIRDGAIKEWIEPDYDCPIEKGSRVKMGDDAKLVRTIDTYYNDVDVNGHINSVKYIEHILDLFPLEWYKQYDIRRFEIAYVAETHQGDKLNFYSEELNASLSEERGASLSEERGASLSEERGVRSEECSYNIRVTKTEKETSAEVEVCRSKICFVKK